MKLTLKREIFGKDFTLGSLYINDSFICYTVEDVDRKLETLPKEERCNHKVYGKTAIPKGTYTVVLSYSNRFKRYLPLITNVDCFTGIRIHSGNTAEDSLGCIIVGMERTPNGVAKSKIAETHIVAAIKKVEKKEKILIEIL